MEAGSWEGLWVPRRVRLLGTVIWEWGGTSVVQGYGVWGGAMGYRVGLLWRNAYSKEGGA